jgi:FkbM family methyltransferase
MLDRLKLSWAWKLFPSARLNLKTLNGVKIPLRAKGDFPSLEEIFLNRVYTDLMEGLPNPILSWVDLGCNAGMFSAWLYDRAGGALHRPDCRALMVEPGVCAKTAQEFVNLNGLKNFKVVEACIGDGNPVTFYESKSSTRSSSAIKPDSREKLVRMETITVEALLNQYDFQEVDFLKVDIEGAEKDLLLAKDLFRRFRAGILEWHAETTTGQQVVDWIKAHGGRVVKVVSQDGHVAEPLASRVGMISWVRE